MKTIQKSLILVVTTFFVGIITAFPSIKTQVENNNSNLIDARTVIQISGTKWATIDSSTFDSGDWVWANLTNGGRVTDQQVPDNADILSVDLPVKNVTATDRTSAEEVLISAYQNLPTSFSRSRNPIYLGSTYQYLLFLPSGVLPQITADGIITKTEVSKAEKLGSAIIYSGNQEVNGVLMAAYMDNVLYNPADFNSRFGDIDKFSFVDVTNDEVIPTMYSFSTMQGAEEYANQRNQPLISLEKLQELNINKEIDINKLSLFAEPKLNAPCTIGQNFFHEHKNYGGGMLSVQVNFFLRLDGTWWDKRISSVKNALNAQYTMLYERVDFNSPFVRFHGPCGGSSNLRRIGFNDRASFIMTV